MSCFKFFYYTCQMIADVINDPESQFKLNINGGL